MKAILLATLSASALMAAQPLMAETLVYCSEGSPENFAPSVNTTGTSFDANTQIYDTIVQFERGGTKLQPALAEKWDISPDGLTYTALALGQAPNGARTVRRILTSALHADFVRR